MSTGATSGNYHADHHRHSEDCLCSLHVVQQAKMGDIRSFKSGSGHGANVRAELLASDSCLILPVAADGVLC